MSLLFDAIIIVICAVCIISGIVRGFIKSIMKLGSGIASALVAYAFTPEFAPTVSEKYLLDGISSGLRDTISSVCKTGDGAFNLTKLFEDMPDAFTQILSRYGADANTLQASFGDIDAAAASAVESLASSIAKPVSDTLATVLTFIVLFAGCFIALALVTWILDLIFHLPVLKTANKVLGALFGAILAVVMAWITALISIALIRAMTPVYPDMFNESIITNSLILNFFDSNNLMTIFTDYFNSVKL